MTTDFDKLSGEHLLQAKDDMRQQVIVEILNTPELVKYNNDYATYHYDTYHVDCGIFHGPRFTCDINVYKLQSNPLVREEAKPEVGLRVSSDDRHVYLGVPKVEQQVALIQIVEAAKQRSREEKEREECRRLHSILYPETFEESSNE